MMMAAGGCGPEAPVEYRWNEAGGYRWSALPIEGDEPGFALLGQGKTGISFVNHLPKDDIFENRHYLNGSGVALADVDGDGWTDAYFARLNGPNSLYRNHGNFHFEEVTDSAGLAHDGFYSTSAAFADVDGDADPDLLVGSMSRDNMLYINDGSGHFTPKQNSGLAPAQGTMSMALADIDADGDLDLYVTNYKRKSVLDLFNINDLAWERTVKEPYDPDRERGYTLVPPYDEHYTILYNEGEVPGRREIGRKDVLYLNRGDGTFRQADLKKHFRDSEGKPAGLEADFGLMARFHDINRDGRPDLYVNNDYWTRDRIWINQGEGIFQPAEPTALRNMSFSSMSVDFSDINRDHADDFFVTEMLSPVHERRLRQFIPDDPYPEEIGIYRNTPQYNRNSLYLNRGDNTYAEISYFSNLEASEWSWASRFLDVDLDGYEDLLVTAGYTYDVQDLDAQDAWRNEIMRSGGSGSQIDIYPSLELANKAFRNEGGLHFKEVGAAWGFTAKDVSHGLATADFDHDGDLDLAINRLNDRAAIYENTSGAPRIAIRLTGAPPNTQAVGARLRLEGGPVTQSDVVVSAGEYLSSSDPLLVFAAIENQNHTLRVYWPDGRYSVIDSVRANRIYEIDETAIPKQERPPEAGKESEPVFEDVSDKIAHHHHEESYDDFRVQPLLPQKLSQLGPGVSWIDYDADGDPDLLITAGRGGRLGVYENNDGQFAARSLQTPATHSRADQTTVLGWKQEGRTRLVLGQANYEPGDINFPSVRSFSLASGSVIKRDSLPGIFSTTGPLAAADYDGDGDLDLFVGGRFVPAHYPMNATSRLFENDDGTFAEDPAHASLFRELGLVTGAVFTDYDSDGDPDLLCSLEWGPLKLFENENGTFSDVTEAAGLHRYHGWWNGVATGDFNGDGRPDIVATNRGTNSPYQLDGPEPLKMFYDDFNRDGRIDIFESYYHAGKQGYVPRRQMKTYESISEVFAGQVQSNEAFANATLAELLRPRLETVSSKKINTLRHMVFLNGDDGFRAEPLPAMAQWTAAYHAGVADYDNDGSEDLFLSQNFFGVRPNTPRLDAGRGLWLKGEGTGHFKAVPGQKSGILVYGEQRGAALGDYNMDGRVDLAISQNGAATKLYENKTTKRGIRIRLIGPAVNADAVGSSLRLLYPNGQAGPRREIQAGSGYWSQNSLVQVLGFAEKPRAIEVVWFDGRTDTVAYTEAETQVIRYQQNGP